MQFWIQTTAIILYFSSMWIAGITQGMMWRAIDEFGNLAYSFIDTATVPIPYCVIRGDRRIPLSARLFYVYLQRHHDHNSGARA
ncbi:MAG: hypothetical protein ACTTH5_03365 [Wolinella sp.]